MKIYEFILISHDENRLYAFTDNRDYRDIFLQLRNMNIFIYEVINMSKNEFKEFRKKYKTCELIEPKECKIICTGTEYDYIVDDGRYRLNEILVEQAVHDPNLFKTKYYKALQLLLYNLVYEVSSDDDMYVDEFIHPNIFHLFYINFKNTLKKG